MSIREFGMMWKSSWAGLSSSSPLRVGKVVTPGMEGLISSGGGLRDLVDNMQWRNRIGHEEQQGVG